MIIRGWLDRRKKLDGSFYYFNSLINYAIFSVLSNSTSLVEQGHYIYFHNKRVTLALINELESWTYVAAVICVIDISMKCTLQKGRETAILIPRYVRKKAQRQLQAAPPILGVQANPRTTNISQVIRLSHDRASSGIVKGCALKKGKTVGEQMYRPRQKARRPC